MRQKQKYPEGYYISLGIAIGLPLGLPLAIATDNYGLMAIGIAIGVAIGAAFEEKAKKEGRIRPLTKQEKKQRKLMTWAGIALLLLGVLAFLLIFLLNR